MQRFDASQPTASQLLPPPESPQPSLPPQQHHQHPASPQQGRSNSDTAEEPEALDPIVQHSPQEAVAGDSAHGDAAQAGFSLSPRAGLRALRGRSSDRAILLSDIKQAEPGRASSGQAVPRAASTAQDAKDSAGPAPDADVEVLADSPALPSGQPGSPASSSDLQLESFPGAAIPHAAPLEAIESGRAQPPGSAAGLGSKAVQREASSQQAAAGQGQSPVASEAMPADSDSEGEPEEPLWEPEPEPEPAPVAPARFAAHPCASQGTMLRTWHLLARASRTLQSPEVQTPGLGRYPLSLHIPVNGLLQAYI